MMDRRRFLQASLLTTALPLLSNRLFAATIFVNHQTVLSTALENQWEQLPVGELMGKIGQMFLTTPYVGGTLEGPGPEVCRVLYDKLDCVTYFELVLALARTIKSNCVREEDVVAEITRTRYRNGVIDGYASRLHYTAEWIHDNIVKQVVVDITEGVKGAEVFPLHVDFMSKHPQYYAPLKDDPAIVTKIAAIESRINATPRWFIPKERVRASEGQLRTGDIVAIATSKAGLDYAHTGMILVDENGAARFMHASTSKKMVVLDTTISEYLSTVAAHIGITVVRPLEPNFYCTVDGIKTRQ